MLIVRQLQEKLLYMLHQKMDIDIVQFLLDSGADIDMVNDKGWNALHIASNGGYVDIVNLLLDRGININAKTNVG